MRVAGNREPRRWLHSVKASCERPRTAAHLSSSKGLSRWRPIVIPTAAILLAAILNTVFILNAYVPSGSMEPTIHTGAMVLGDRLAYLGTAPQPEDIIFFRHAESGEDRWLVKRVVAVPGQTFAVTDGLVYIDGQLLCEDYVDNFSDDDYLEVLVPENSYIVLGDNRQESKDSRFWEDPFVRREDIGAKGMFVYFPEFCKL